MSRRLWLNPVFGVSGDMLLGALIGAGADVDQVVSGLSLLDVRGWDFRVEIVSRRGIRATRAVVEAASGDHRPWSEIDDLLAAAGLPAQAADRSRATFRLLAEVEAGVHGVDVDAVHFHEVGAVDSIVDIVGCWLALADLGVDRVSSGPIGLGAGALKVAHGGLPNPGPAVLGLLESLPVTGVDVAYETVTPTGAALLKTMVDDWGPPPSGTLAATGLGSGTMDPESHANVLSATIVESSDVTTVNSLLLETNVDDVTPEVLGHVMETALDMGADDAWVVPIVMKKGRPGHQVRILTPPSLETDLAGMLARETGTLGIRKIDVTKQVLPRSSGSVQLDGFEIAIKQGPHGAKPEFDDVRRVALETGRTLAEVSRMAMAEWNGRAAG